MSSANHRMTMMMHFWDMDEVKECVDSVWVGVGIELPGVQFQGTRSTALLKIEGDDVLAHLGWDLPIEGDDVIVGDDPTQHIHLIIEMAYKTFKPSRENADRHLQVQNHINEVFDFYFSNEQNGGELFKSSPYNNLRSMLFEDENQEKAVNKDSQIWHYSSKNLHKGHPMHVRFGKQLEEFKSILEKIVSI